MNYASLSSAIALGLASLLFPTPVVAQDEAVAPQPPEETDPLEGAIVYAPPREYSNHSQLAQALLALQDSADGAVVGTTLGPSRGEREIYALRIALDGVVAPDSRPALLIVAGIDGDHLVGTDVAIDVARRLVEKAANGDERTRTLLSNHTIYIVPRLNPDAAEHSFDETKLDWRRNLRPVDDDRDVEVDDDHPNDLNGDGLITMMRIYDPEKADLRADPDEPRLHLKPDRNKGERAEFALIVEGIDDDGDEEINEDWIGGVDLNRNFPHGYDEHSDGAGPYMLSEPESLVLVDFVLDRPNIAVALTYGVHDNLSKTPDGKGQHPSSTPKNIDEDDVGLYTHIGERFREITGLKSAPNEAASGAFFEWAYTQFGIPSFTTPLWTRPEPAGEEKGGEQGSAPKPASEEDAEQLTPSGVGDISQETIDELEAAAEAAGIVVTDEMRAQVTPADVEQFAGMMNIKIRRVKKDGDAPAAAPTNGGEKKKGSDANKEEVAWLKYSDEQRGGEGFVTWTEVEHPEFDRVEVGGWSPYFKLNPPAAEVDAIAEKQVEFVLELLSKLPTVSITEPEVKRLSAGLFEIKLAVVNDGYFPTGTAMAVRNRKGRPYVLRLDLPIEKIVSGQRVQKYWSIPGSGGRQEARWIIMADDGASVDAILYSEKLGEVRRSIRLVESEAGEVGVDDVDQIQREVRP